MAQATQALSPTPDPAAVPVLLHRLAPGVGVPAAAHPGDAGVDLVTTDPVELAPGERCTVGTGIAVALPDGHAAFVLPRSGLAARHGLTVVNAPGTVDAGYRGEIRVTLLNTDARTPLRLSAGDRVAQLVVLPVPRIRFIEVERLPGSARGTDGFGSTGTATATATATGTGTGTGTATGSVPGPRP
ncbi:MAG: dUTP diphosphatase [Actinomycetales bacterium]